jgi:hypothetical protein
MRPRCSEALIRIKIELAIATVISQNIGFPNSIAMAAAAVAAVESDGGSSI